MDFTNFARIYEVLFIFFRQLSEAQETLKMSSSDVEAMREEFAKRLSSTEKKLQAVVKASEGTYNS